MLKMTSVKCLNPQSASTISILRDVNGNEVTSVGVSRQSFISKVKRHHYSKLEIFLVILLLLLLVALIVVVVISKREKYNDNNSNNIQRYSEGAIKNIARILKNVDRNAKPCTDFYQYACGGWKKNNYVDDSDNFVAQYLIVGKKNKRKLKEILENMEIKKIYSTNPAMLKAFKIYSSCTNKTEMEKFGDSQLRKLLSELAGFNMTKNSSFHYEWQNFVVKIKRRLGLDVFFKLQILDDLRNSSIRRITMRAVQLPLKYEYYTDEKNTTQAKKSRQQYVEFMTDVMTLITSGKRESVEREMKEVLDLETRVAKTQLARNQRNNFSVIYNLVSIEELSNTTKLDWLSFFRNLTSGSGYVLTLEEMLLISSQKMVKDITVLLNNTKASVISNYLTWKIVYSLMEILPSKYERLYSSYRGQLKSRWDICVQETSEALPLETTLLFSQHALPKYNVKEAKSIVDNVKDVLINQTIPKQLWMDERTKKGAIEKAKAMIFHVGYPENVNSNLLNNTSSKFLVDGSYFNIYQNIKSFMVMKQMKSLKAIKNRNEYFETDPMKPTAFYYPTRNTVGISIGFLQSQLFSQDNYPAFKFGSFGMVVGHEITHGYDSRGLKFDKNGDQQPWVSKNSSLKLSYKHLCLKESYSNLRYKNRKLGSVGDYRQQYCDNGGLTLAFEAYKKWKIENIEEEVVPGFDITHNQLFFLSYAQMWCAKYKDSEEVNMGREGGYPFSMRVQGTVMNSKEFADAFSCAQDTTMNPQNKCIVWET